MKEAKISEVKNQLSRYLSFVRRGESVRILDRATPVAMLVPLSHSIGDESSDAALLAQMERKGLIRRGAGRMDREILDVDPPGKPAGVLKALLEERDRR
jgi:prevent-host-death family protein